MSKFLLRHQQAYGLEIVDRDASTGTVSAVRCLFCARLGRDPMPEGAQRQRKRRVMVWRQFSTKNYRAHHEGQHAAHWTLYEECTPAEKDAFFDVHAGDNVVMASPLPAPQMKEKRRVGRPRKDASAPTQWSDEMTQRLVELRTDVFATWFADPSNKSDVYDGWDVVASTLTEEYNVTLNVEQCRAKYNLLEAPAQESSGEQQATTSSSSTVTASNGVAAAPATTEQDATASTAAPVTTALIVAPERVVTSVTAPMSAAAPTIALATAPVTATPTTEQAPPQVSAGQALTIAQGFSGAIDPTSNKYFDPQHEQEYGVEIVERDPVTQAPVAVQCLFCVHMGRDPAPETSKRQRSQRVWVWKKFGAKNYRRHHERMHAELWPLYESSSAADKAAFFTVHKDYQPGTLPPVVRPSAPAPVSTATAIMMQNMMATGGGGAGMMMPNMMPGVGLAPGVNTAMMASGGAPAVPMKRPRGRPRKNGIAAIQWTEAMVERLVMLRLGAFETWFANKQNHSALHDGWMLVASALASEFGVLVDSEQCKSKFRLLRAQTQNRTGDQANVNAVTGAAGDGNPGSAVKRPRLSSNGDTMSLASATATINLLLNSEQNVDAQALLQRALGPAEARQQQHQPQQQPMHVEEDADSSGSESEEGSSSGGEGVNTLLLVRILRALEEHKAAFDAQREAASAQTKSIRELLQFLRGRETEI